MSQATESTTTQRIRVAAITAAGVAAVLFVQNLIANVNWLVMGSMQVPYNDGRFLGPLWLSVVYGVAILLVFAAGVFLSLWLLAPVRPSVNVKQVLLRGLLAAAIGAGAVLVVFSGWAMTGRAADPLFGSSFPWPSLDRAVQTGSVAFQSGMNVFLRHAPVVLLVVLLVWIWPGRQRPRHADPVVAGEV